MIVTVYKNALDIKNPHWVEVDIILERIKNGKIKNQIEKLRTEEDEKKRKELKKRLPSICFSGKFTDRTNATIEQHSGLCVIDFDHIINLLEKKQQICGMPFVYSCFISPSGDGIKAVVRIPANIEKHQGYYEGILNLFPELDTTSRNISRVCFESWDPEIYINKEAIEFTDYIDPKPDYQSQTPIGSNFKYNDYAKANIPLKMIREAVDGTKHATLLRASKLMGGYVSGGQMSESEAYRLLESEMQSRDNGNFEGDKKTIKDGIEYGKKNPIVEEEYVQNIYVQPKTSGIKRIDSVWESMKRSFINGKARGTTTYFNSFDEHFTWKVGELTLVIGKGNSGKTEFILQLMLIKSLKEDWKWAIFSPENYPADEFYDTLIHSYIGKTTDPYYRNYQMSMTEYEKGYQFVRKHFFYVYPDETHTIEEIDANFTALIEDEKINGTLIDPYNQVIVPSFTREDQFLSLFLTQRKQFTIKHNLCNVICTHPKNMQKNKDGEYDVADVYDIAGGAMWSNKIDNILSVHRPDYIRDPKSTKVEIHIKKIKKQKLVGIPGVSEFNFNRTSNRYTQNDFTPLNNKSIVVTEPSYNPNSRIESNKDFFYETEQRPDPFDNV